MTTKWIDSIGPTSDHYHGELSASLWQCTPLQQLFYDPKCTITKVNLDLIDSHRSIKLKTALEKYLQVYRQELWEFTKAQLKQQLQQYQA